jgi:Xaa-Pro aminopeptidase
MRETRLHRVLQILENRDLHGCILKGMDNIFYLTGFRGSEGTVLVTRGDVILLTDSRYTTYANDVAQGCIVVETKGRDQGLADLTARYGLKKIGFDATHTNYQVYYSWKKAMDQVEFVPLDDDIEAIRRCKDAEEILAIRKAIDVSTNAFATIVERIRPGVTEREIAIDLDYTMQRLGAEKPSFDTIVASGPRAALPHGQPTDRILQAGEPLVIDFGAQVNGYCSDETVTVCVGKPERQIGDICTVVRDAKQKGVEAVRPGLPVRELDAIVRGYIEDKGYGDFFRHGTGHGVGIAVHEAPAITARVEGLLEEHMVLTIEPGIYLPNIGGVRLEDMVLVTGTGPEVLTRLRKDLIEV